MAKRCPDKARYPHREVALTCLASLLARGSGQTRIYRCRVCKGWHTTSQPLKRTRGDGWVHRGLIPLLTLPGHEDPRRAKLTPTDVETR